MGGRRSVRETQRILGIGWCSGGPALNRSTSADELFGRDLNGIERRTNHHEPAVGPGPSIRSDIAFELGAVARITRAPPRLCNSSAAFFVLLSL